jgi:hypothetical protein
MMVSSRDRNSAGSSLPPGSFGRIGNSSSATPPIESPDPAARNRKHVLQKLCGRRRSAGIIVAVTIDGEAAWPETPVRMI